MPTPVGPAPRDPNDPDLWDWSGEDTDKPMARRRPGLALLAVLVVVAMVLALVVSSLA